MSDATLQISVLLITSIFGLLTTIAGIFAAFVARSASATSKATHDIVNSQLAEWKQIMTEAERAKGRLEERSSINSGIASHVQQAVPVAPEPKETEAQLVEQAAAIAAGIAAGIADGKADAVTRAYAETKGQRKGNP